MSNKLAMIRMLLQQLTLEEKVELMTDNDIPSISPDISPDISACLCEVINKLADKNLITLNHLIRCDDLSNCETSKTFSIYAGPHGMDKVSDVIKNQDNQTLYLTLKWLQVISFFEFENSPNRHKRCSVLIPSWKSIDASLLLENICQLTNLSLVKEFLSHIGNYTKITNKSNNANLEKIVIVCKSVMESYSNDSIMFGAHVELKNYPNKLLYKHVKKDKYTVHISKSYTIDEFNLKYPFSQALIEYHELSGINSNIADYLSHHPYSDCYVFIDETILNDMLLVHTYNKHPLGGNND